MELLPPANIAQHREEGAWPRGPEQWPCAEVLIPWPPWDNSWEAGVGERAEDRGILSVGRRTRASKGKLLLGSCVSWSAQAAPSQGAAVGRQGPTSVGPTSPSMDLKGCRGFVGLSTWSLLKSSLEKSG